MLRSPDEKAPSSSFLGLPYRILNMKPKKELLWGLWVGLWGVELGNEAKGNAAYDLTLLGLRAEPADVQGLGFRV